MRIAPQSALLALALLAGPAPRCLADAKADARKLAVEATEVLRKYCYKCHGVEFKVPGYNVLDRDSLVAKHADGEDPYITPGDPKKSTLWDRMASDEPETGERMPPKGPRPSAEERKAVQDWIAAGATFPDKVASRKAVTDADVLRAIRDHLRGLDRDEAQSWRFFTLEALHNNPKVRDDQIRLARAAVSKLANSLSRRPIALPEAIGPGQTILAFDIRKFGWAEPDAWSTLLRAYPYGLKYTRSRDPALRRLAEELDDLVGDDVGLPFVRADWFIDQAARPPLYHKLLGLPETAEELERQLGVSVEDDFLHGTLRRAGFARSGVSHQNRLVDRHDASSGYYWKSYDFRHDDGTSNVFRAPLGPVFAANPFPKLAFEQAGGEIIFSLPNRLQAYLLVNEKGRRIDAGPTDVVGDENKHSGTTEVINGLSCMGCHREGMKPFVDELRAGAAVSGKAQRTLERLVPEADEWKRVLADDQAQYLRAEEAVTGPFLKVGEDGAKTIREFPEPISTVAHLLYQKELGPEEMAAELGFGDAESLLALIRANPRLRTLGLGVLLNGGAIKRPEWDSLRNRPLSTFQQSAIELDRGTPYRKF